MTTITPRLDYSEKNLCINGNMDFWQRGTSFTGLTLTDQFLADRFCFSPFNPTGVFTYARSTDVPTLAQSGFQSAFSTKLTVTTANSGGNLTTVLRYSVEGYDLQPFFGKGFRLQFWVKTSVAGTYTVEFTNYNTSPNLRTYLTTYTISAGQINSWQPVVMDLTMDTVTSLYAFDNTLGLKIHWHLDNFNGSSTLNQWFSASTSPLNASTQVAWGQTIGATWQIAQVMLVPNNLSQIAGQSIAFHRAGNNIAHELQMCQRYCETSTESPFFSAPGTLASVNPGNYWNGYSNSGTLIPIYFKVQKRMAPVGGASLVGVSFRAFSTSGTVDNVRDNSALVDRPVSYTGSGGVINTTGTALYVPTAVSGAYHQFLWIVQTEL